MAKLTAGLREVLHPLLDAVGRAWRRPVQATVPVMVAHRARSVPLHEASHAEDRCYDVTPVRSSRMEKRATPGAMTWDADLGRYRPEESRQAFTQFSVDPILAGASPSERARPAAEVVVIDALVRFTSDPEPETVHVGADADADPPPLNEQRQDVTPIAGHMSGDAIDATEELSSIDSHALAQAVEASLHQASLASAAVSDDFAVQFQDLFSIDPVAPTVKIDASQVSDEGFKLGLEVD